jgi:glycerol-3-phosphate dehydrogenase (NAD(P)+)
MKKIAIIGYGELGQAIHKLLEIRKDLIIDIWDKKGQQDQKSLGDVVLDAYAVFICVPSWCVRDVALGIKKLLNEETIIICLAKGIEEKTLKTMDAVLIDELSDKQIISILSGPMLAEELMVNKMGFAVVATKNIRDFNKILFIFKETHLTIIHSSDFGGVAISGVLKNIYALGLGIVDGLKLGSNSKGDLTVMAISEMRKIIKLLGGRDKTVLGIAGLGDLIATGFSDYSRNRKTGEEMVKTGVCCLESEGYRSLASIVALLDNNIFDMPFLTALKYAIIYHKDPANIFKDILSSKL